MLARAAAKIGQEKIARVSGAEIELFERDLAVLSVLTAGDPTL